jgi:uncharacterized protein (TIGR02246 family)
MRAWLAPISIALSLAGLAAHAREPEPGTDESIRRLASEWERAWNEHDASILADLLTQDADFVSARGEHWKRRERIVREHAARLGAQLRESRWTTRDVSLQLIQPDVALVYVAWTLSGDRAPDGNLRPPRDNLASWVVVQSEGAWRIRAAHTTSVAAPAAR